LLSLGWTSAGESGRGATLEAIASLAAAILLVVSTTTGMLEQSAIGDEPSRAERTSGDAGSGLAPGKETVVGAFTGAPYTYPSKLRLEGDPRADLTVDPVHWYTDPFHNPIYYGGRISRWFTGGKTGTMVDFIHSKAIADQEKEADFSGTLDGKPVPPRARIGQVFRKLEFSHGHNMLLFNGLVRLPGIGPRLSPYAGAGAGVLLPHTEVQLAIKKHKRTYEYNYAGPAAQALLGLEVRLARMSFFVEYKFTWGHYEAPLSQMDGGWLPVDLVRQAKRWLAGEAPPGGHVSTEIVSHQVVSGISVRVAPAP
jgi:hypothetical protein